MDSRLVEVAGGRARVRVYEAGSGEPLLFLHGAGGLLPDDPFIARLAERYRVHAPILPGYEDSEGEDTLRDMLAVTLHGFDVMAALGLDRPVLVGHSMGGMIAAEMAAAAPKEVERLALIAPAGLWLDERPVADLFSKLPFELPELLFADPEFGARLLTAGSGVDDSAFITDFLIQNARRLAMAGKLLFPIPERGLADRLYRVTARTMLIWGEQDRVIDPAYADAFRQHIPQAEIARIPRAGHLVIYERPDAVAEAIGRLSSTG